MAYLNLNGIWPAMASVFKIFQAIQCFTKYSNFKVRFWKLKLKDKQISWSLGCWSRSRNLSKTTSMFFVRSCLKWYVHWNEKLRNWIKISLKLNKRHFNVFYFIKSIEWFHWRIQSFMVLKFHYKFPPSIL